MKRVTMWMMAAVTLLAGQNLFAETIAYTGFEECGQGSRYYETITNPGYLPNGDPGSAIVDWSPGAGDTETGFRTYYNGTDGPVDPCDRAIVQNYDYIGVHNFFNNSGSGSYEFDDADPEIIVELDEIDVSAFTNVVVSFYFKMRASGPEGIFEADDFVEVQVVWKDAAMQETTLVPLSLQGQAANDFFDLNGYDWVYYSQAVPDEAVSVQFKFVCHTDDYKEGAQLDDVVIVGSGGQATKTESYGWEDGNDVMDTFNNIVVENTTTDNHTPAGARSLYLERGVGNVPQAYIARVTNLANGDVVNASIFAKTDQYSGFQTGSIALAAIYVDNAGDYVGYAGEATTYSGTDWTEVTGGFAYIPPTGATGMIIQARVYNESGDSGWLDDLSVTVPTYAAVSFPTTSKTYPATKTESYGWEDKGVVLGVFDGDSDPNDGISVSNVFNESYAGTRSLKVKRWFGASQAPEAYVALIDGLNDLDVVRASFQAKTGIYSGDPNNGSIRIWAHYIADSDINNYAGSANGNELYCGNEWTELSGLWLYDAGTLGDRTGMVIKARGYTDGGDFGWVDDLIIEVPTTATVTFPEPNGVDPVCTNPMTDLNDDCKTTVTEVQFAANEWLNDGTGPFVDMSYKYEGYNWSDPCATILGSWNEPNCILSTTEYLTGGQSLECRLGTTYAGPGECYVAYVEGLQDGDDIYVAVTMKSGGEEDAYLTIGGHHIRNGNYAGGEFTTDGIQSSDQWQTYSARMYFDVGDLTQHDPRTGLALRIYANGDYGQLAGYVDRVVIAYPYREDQGVPLSWVDFPATGYDETNMAEWPTHCANRPDADFNLDCVVDLFDAALIGQEWLECGWDTEANCL